jgi:hypothetical protein
MKRQSLLNNRLVFSLSTLLVVVVFSFSALAQQGTSSVRGTVKDPQGNVVAGATVDLINLATNTSRSITTSDNGTYGFELIPPGDYRIEVGAKGFKKGVVTTFMPWWLNQLPSTFNWR